MRDSQLRRRNATQKANWGRCAIWGKIGLLGILRAALSGEVGLLPCEDDFSLQAGHSPGQLLMLPLGEGVPEGQGG